MYKRPRGVWGETQLRRVVEAAGLPRHVDFDLQSSLSSDAGAGRPDMVVRLPGGKALALDAASYTHLTLPTNSLVSVFEVPLIFKSHRSSDFMTAEHRRER